MVLMVIITSVVIKFVGWFGNYRDLVIVAYVRHSTQKKNLAGYSEGIEPVT